MSYWDDQIRSEQRDMDLCRAAAALIDAKLSRQDVINALLRYWEIPREDAIYYASVMGPAMRLYRYLVDEGFDYAIAEDYAHRLESDLTTNGPCARMTTPQKQYEYLVKEREKHAIRIRKLPNSQ